MGYKGYIIFSSIPRYSQMQTMVTQYYRKRKATTQRKASAKRYKSRGRFRRRYGLRMNKPGTLVMTRWSSAANNNCHILIGGNDTLPGGTGTSVFAMGNVNGYTEMLNLFDNFRIVSVKYRWICARNPDLATTVNNRGIYPRVTWCHDFNDGVTISRDAIYQRAKVYEEFFTDSKQCSRWYSIKPAALIQMYESPTNTCYGPKWRQWMDTNDYATPHYGIKYAWSELYAGVDLRCEAKITFEFKGIS